MKTRYLIAMTAALSISATAFAANDGKALFKKYNCSMCHSVTKKAVGPAVEDIYEKYSGDSEAQEKLEKKVRIGGSGVWGSMPMPPSPKSVSDENIKTMVQWVLSRK